MAPPKLPGYLESLLDRDAEVGRALERVKGRLRTGRVGRAFEMSKIAAGGSKLLIGRALDALGNADTEAAANERGRAFALELIQTFAELRGVAMKLGQMLSYLEDLMPPEARKVLAVLQREAPPMDWEAVRAQFVAELGRPPEEVFAEFDEAPMAAASIGQVHRARLRDGTEVAVKIQYPGIADAMRADLKNAKVMSLFQRVFFFRTNTRAIMAEIEERLLDECDYAREAEYQLTFGRRFAGHPRIVVPKVFPELSTQRVLVTELHRGDTFYEWLAREPSREERDAVARTFYRFYLGSFYLDGLFNCDPHPGNYLFREDGKIAFLDYGCTRRFPEDRLAAWIGMCHAVSSDDRGEIERQALALGFFAPETSYDYEAFRALLRYLYAAYLEDAPFDFRVHKPERTFREMFVDNPNLFKLDMPADSVFLNRITFGLVSLLTDIGGSVNAYRYCRAYFAGTDPDWPEDPFRGRRFTG